MVLDCLVVLAIPYEIHCFAKFPALFCEPAGFQLVCQCFFAHLFQIELSLAFQAIRLRFRIFGLHIEPKLVCHCMIDQSIFHSLLRGVVKIFLRPSAGWSDHKICFPGFLSEILQYGDTVQTQRTRTPKYTQYQMDVPYSNCQSARLSGMPSLPQQS